MSSSSSECTEGKRNVSDPKKPCKGILKNSASFEKPASIFPSNRKSAKFDEENVQKTYHPPDKDYGHMTVYEPKTPFVFGSSTDSGYDFDPDLLAKKLQIAADTQTPMFVYDEDSDDDFMETPTERVRRIAFERRRKVHYKNEFNSVALARKLIQVDLENDDESSVGETPSVEDLSLDPDCVTTSMRLNLSTNASGSKDMSSGAKADKYKQ